MARRWLDEQGTAAVLGGLDPGLGEAYVRYLKERPKGSGRRRLQAALLCAPA